MHSTQQKDFQLSGSAYSIILNNLHTRSTRAQTRADKLTGGLTCVSDADLAEAWEMSPFALKMVVLTLLLSALYLASVGASLWFGAYQFQNIIR